MRRSASGAPPSERDILRTNHAIAMMEKIKALAVPMGCSPDGEIDPEHSPVMDLPATEPVQEMEAMGWFPLKNIIIQAMPTIIDEIGLDWIRKMSERSPLPINYNDADLKALLLETLAESQQST